MAFWVHFRNTRPHFQQVTWGREPHRFTGETEWTCLRKIPLGLLPVVRVMRQDEISCPTDHVLHKESRSWWRQDFIPNGPNRWWIMCNSTTAALIKWHCWCLSGANPFPLLGWRQPRSCMHACSRGVGCAGEAVPALLWAIGHNHGGSGAQVGHGSSRWTHGCSSTAKAQQLFSSCYSEYASDKLELIAYNPFPLYCKNWGEMEAKNNAQISTILKKNI